MKILLNIARYAGRRFWFLSEICALAAWAALAPDQAGGGAIVPVALIGLALAKTSDAMRKWIAGDRGGNLELAFAAHMLGSVLGLALVCVPFALYALGAAPGADYAASAAGLLLLFGSTFATNIAWAAQERKNVAAFFALAASGFASLWMRAGPAGERVPDGYMAFQGLCAAASAAAFLAMSPLTLAGASQSLLLFLFLLFFGVFSKEIFRALKEPAAPGSFRDKLAVPMGLWFALAFCVCAYCIANGPLSAAKAGAASYFFAAFAVYCLAPPAALFLRRAAMAFAPVLAGIAGAAKAELLTGETDPAKQQAMLEQKKIAKAAAQPGRAAPKSRAPL